MKFCAFLAYPSLRGSTPLDVAAASMKNNEELALALRQHHLESVIKCLGDCGLASNSILLARFGLVSFNTVSTSLFLRIRGLFRTVVISQSYLKTESNLKTRSQAIMII